MLTISQTIRSTETPDGAILLDVRRGQIFGVNLIGAKILLLLREGSDERQIAAAVSVGSGEPIDTVSTDVRDFLETLRQQSILNEGEPEASDDHTDRA
jgi:hypothetical protein